MGALVKLRKVTISFVTSVCLSVCPHGTPRLPLTGFSWQVIFEYFSKFRGQNSRKFKMTSVCLPHRLFRVDGNGGNIELTGEGGRSCSVVCVRAAAVRGGDVKGRI